MREIVGALSFEENRVVAGATHERLHVYSDDCTWPSKDALRCTSALVCPVGTDSCIKLDPKSLQEAIHVDCRRGCDVKPLDSSTTEPLLWANFDAKDVHMRAREDVSLAPGTNLSCAQENLRVICEATKGQGEVMVCSSYNERTQCWRIDAETFLAIGFRAQLH